MRHDCCSQLDSRAGNGVRLSCLSAITGVEELYTQSQFMLVPMLDKINNASRQVNTGR